MALDLSPALAILRRDVPELAGVYRFGSVAYGTDRPDSDVDIAIYAGRPLDRVRVLELQEAIARALKRDVDLVDLAAASTILQVKAIGEGRLLEAADPDAIGFFEVRVLRDYYDLKARRAEIEADIVKRGRVYAG